MYQRFWQYVQDNPERYIVNSNKDGLKSLLNHNTVYYGSKGQLTEGYNKYSQDISPIVQFAKGNTEYYSLILTKNSPLTPFFKKLAWKSIESGLRDALMREWFGPPIYSSESKTTTLGLTLEQTFLIFVVILGSLLVSLFIYFLEVMWKKGYIVIYDFNQGMTEIMPKHGYYQEVRAKLAGVTGYKSNSDISQVV